MAELQLEKVDLNLLKSVSDLDGVPTGAFSLRKNGKSVKINVTPNINIIRKEDKPGINIYVRADTKGETVSIPVVITESGIDDKVYNDFYIGKNADVIINAGCGIHNDGCKETHHNGIHRFFLEEGAKVLYLEKHYGEGDGEGKRVLDPVTEVHLGKNASLEMHTTQIKGVDSTIRKTSGELDDGASLVVLEKIVGGKATNLPKIFNVNWFRTDDEGHFLWPGFGDNLRVLEWILKRCFDEVDARECELGYIPNAKDINLEGSGVDEKTLDELLTIDRDLWRKEAADIREYYEKFGDKVPKELRESLEKLEQRLK